MQKVLSWVILTILPHGHQSHPTSHILRKPGIHCDSQTKCDSQSTKESTLTFCLPCSLDVLLISFTYHCNIGISQVARVTEVNVASRLPRKSSQCLFWQQSPGCQHDWASVSLLLEEITTEPVKTFDRYNIDLAVAACIYTPLECGWVTLPRKLYLLRRALTSLPWLTYAPPGHPYLLIPCLFIWLDEVVWQQRDKSALESERVVF